jgi:hypothetical protein
MTIRYFGGKTSISKADATAFHRFAMATCKKIDLLATKHELDRSLFTDRLIFNSTADHRAYIDAGFSGALGPAGGKSYHDFGGRYIADPDAINTALSHPALEKIRVDLNSRELSFAEDMWTPGLYGFFRNASHWHGGIPRRYSGLIRVLREHGIAIVLTQSEINQEIKTKKNRRIGAKRATLTRSRSDLVRMRRQIEEISAGIIEKEKKIRILEIELEELKTIVSSS